MRLFRTLFLLTGVTVFMPSPPEDSARQPMTVEAAQAAPGLMSSATMAIADVAGFCGRQPGVCETAGYVADRLEAKAKYNVRLIYEWAAESSGEQQLSPLPDQAEASDPLATGSADMIVADASPPPSQSTLRIDDIIPEWRGPVPRKKKG